MGSKPRLVGKVLGVAHKMLEDITTVFEENDIKYIVESGTLLGIVRENRLLPWDYDIDISITEDYEQKVLALKWKFFMMGYRFKPKYYKVDAGPFKKGTLRIIKVSRRKFLFFPKHRICDIFIKRTIENEEENYCWTENLTPAILKYSPKRFYDEVTQIEFNGKRYLVPKDSIGYLEHHYGKDWRVPNKEWDYRYDDNCKQEILKNIRKK